MVTDCDEHELRTGYCISITDWIEVEFLDDWEIATAGRWRSTKQ